MPSCWSMRGLNVLTANAAFVELAGLASAERAIGAKLGNWLGRPAIDLELIVAQLREHSSVRNVATILRTASGGQEEIEVSGVVAPMGPESAGGVCYGFTIRNVGRRLRAGGGPAASRTAFGRAADRTGRADVAQGDRARDRPT